MVMIGDIKEAIESEYWDKVEHWFESNTLTMEGQRFLLTLAKKHCPVSIMELLIRNGADPNEQNHCGDTPLTIALWHSAPLELIDCLIQAGANVNHKNQYGNSPISLSAEMNWVQALDLLLQNGADPNIENNSKDTPLTLATWKGASFQYIHRLLCTTADVNHKNSFGNSAILLACDMNAELKTIQLLVKKGATINQENKLGDSPLTVSVRKNNRVDIIRFLLDRGANVNHRNLSGNCALLLGAEANVKEEIIHLLVNNRFINVNLRNKFGDSPLTLACWKNASLTTVKLLLQAGANTKTRNQNGNSSLSLAMQGNASVLLIQLLKDFDANPQTVDFSKYVDVAHLFEKVFLQMEGISPERQVVYMNRFVEERIHNVQALSSLTFDMLISPPFEFKGGDAAQFLHARDRSLQETTLHFLDSKARSTTMWWWWIGLMAFLHAIDMLFANLAVHVLLWFAYGTALLLLWGKDRQAGKLWWLQSLVQSYLLATTSPTTDHHLTHLLLFWMWHVSLALATLGIVLFYNNP